MLVVSCAGDCVVYTVDAESILWMVVRTGRVSSVHRGAATAREGVLVHLVQPAGGQAQTHQEARETHVHGRGTARQRRTSGLLTCLLEYLTHSVGRECWKFW